MLYRRFYSEALATQQSGHTPPVEKGSYRHDAISWKSSREKEHQPHVSALVTLPPQAIVADVARAAPAAKPKRRESRGTQRRLEPVWLQQVGRLLAGTPCIDVAWETLEGRLATNARVHGVTFNDRKDGSTGTVSRRRKRTERVPCHRDDWTWNRA